jgi:hypothetical protein
VLLTRGANAASTSALWGGTVQSPGKGEGQCQATPTRRAREQHGVGQRTRVSPLKQPGGEGFLTNGLLQHFHVSKIAVFSLQGPSECHSGYHALAH